MRVAIFTLLFVLLPVQSVQGQSTDLTAPFPLGHPQTNEPGVWVPVWLQQVELQRLANLTICVEKRDNALEQLAERTGEVKAARAATTELETAAAALQVSLAATSVALEEAEETAQDRLYWALGSTTAGVVAVLTAVLIEAL